MRRGGGRTKNCSLHPNQEVGGGGTESPLMTSVVDLVSCVRRDMNCVRKQGAVRAVQTQGEEVAGTGEKYVTGNFTVNTV